MISDYIESVETVDDERTIKFSSEIISTNPNKARLYDAIFYDFYDVKKLTLDFSNTKFLSSSGMGLLFDIIRTFSQPDKIQKNLLIIIDSKYRIYSLLKPMVITLATNLHIPHFLVIDRKSS